MEERLKNVFVEVFQIDPGEVTLQSSAETIGQWDSLGHLRLVTTIEQTFNIELTTEEIMEMRDFKKVMDIVAQH